MKKNHSSSPLPIPFHPSHPFRAIPKPEEKKPIRFSPVFPPHFPSFLSPFPPPSLQFLQKQTKAIPPGENKNNKKPSQTKKQQKLSRHATVKKSQKQQKENQKQKTGNGFPFLFFVSFPSPSPFFASILVAPSSFVPSVLGFRAPFVPFYFRFLFFLFRHPSAKPEKDEKKLHRNQKTTKNSPPDPGKSHPNQKKATRFQVFATKPTFFKLHQPLFMGCRPRKAHVFPFPRSANHFFWSLWTLGGQGVVSPRG
eukprot:TRINITY_DN1216_c0_g2_i3.p1 TRINITY_DN1216_c0_g2~~TRINITY_DN1216_c0_g2_i3.p1  ORF type:complete len:253 (+),score=28.47 TRINITY_DN1216_c0_g2_i3:1608-2366(+)